MVNVNEGQLAEFNMAVSYLNRLNSLFYAADESAMNLDAYAWFHALMAIYRELSPLMDQKNLEEAENFRKKIHAMVAKALKLQKLRGITQIDEDLYNELHEFEMKLRKVCKDKGLLMKMQEDARKALK